MALQVLQKTNKKLRKVSEHIADITPEIYKLARQMIFTCQREDGAGLAAPQVGKNIRLIVMEINGKMVVMANPEIVWASPEKEYKNESCLSVRNQDGKLLKGLVERSTTVEVSYKALDGIQYGIELFGFEARCAQHEIDHLDGILFTDGI